MKLEIFEQLLKKIANNEYTDSLLNLSYPEYAYEEDGEQLTDKEGLELVKALETNTYIKELNLANNLFTDQTAIALSKLPNIKEINFELNKLTSIGATAIFQMPLIKLSLMGNVLNELNNENIVTLLANKNLQDLDLRYTKINNELINTLIAKHPTVYTLNLTDVTLDGLQNLAINETIKVLYLENSTITPEISVALAKNTTLRKLYITSGVLPDESAEILASCKLDKLLLCDVAVSNHALEYFHPTSILDMHVTSWGGYCKIPQDKINIWQKHFDEEKHEIQLHGELNEYA